MWVHAMAIPKKHLMNKGQAYYMVASSPEFVHCNLFAYIQYNAYFVRKRLEIERTSHH
jgi:hypothetical protein